MGWIRFPHKNPAFDYAGPALASGWGSLHDGDRIEYPDSDWVRTRIEETPQAAPVNYDGNAAKLAATIEDAWRAFHAGEFESALRLSGQAGHLAHAVANKATGIYASRLEPDIANQQALFRSAIERAETAITLLPEDANSHYFLAFNMGRLGQSISIVEALRKGMGGRIQACLQRTLELEPEHAEAHTAMGMYHAEIINKVGKLMGGMTYGANANQALDHFEEAVTLTPRSPIAHIEFANGLYLLFGDKKLDQVTDLYIKASEFEPRDAMEKLDIELALGELE